MGTDRLPSRVTADAHAVLASTAEAAFASDESSRITVWNDAAESLLGHAASSVIGNRCFEVIRGRDLFGNRFCNESCAVRKMRRHREPIHPFRFRVATKAGDMREAKCSVIVAGSPQTRRYLLIHLIQPFDGHTECDAGTGSGCRPAGDCSPSFDAGSDAQRPAQVLTPREVQVLRLVASGTRTPEIAHALGICSTTVCNHIQHILAKLDAHSKLQAVFIARRDSLI